MRYELELSSRHPQHAQSLHLSYPYLEGENKEFLSNRIAAVHPYLPTLRQCIRVLVLVNERFFQYPEEVLPAG